MKPLFTTAVAGMCGLAGCSVAEGRLKTSSNFCPVLNVDFQSRQRRTKKSYKENVATC
jgi:hypothetical protein